LNGDGVIDSQDAVYADLRVWVDRNSDGVTETGELKTLASLGIVKIDLNAKTGAATDNGNILGLTSTYQTSDGVTHEAADVWFRADRQTVTTLSAGGGAQSVDSAIAALGKATAAGSQEPTKLEVVPAQSVGVLPSASPAFVPNTAFGHDNLRTKVSGMAQAIGTFADAGLESMTGPGGGAQMPGSGQAASAGSLASTAMVGMADVLKQFDSNGNLIGSQMNAAASANKALTLPGVHEPTANGILATGGKP
jgi:hypothetical protein